jgi:hypothetical protein
MKDILSPRDIKIATREYHREVVGLLIAMIVVSAIGLVAMLRYSTIVDRNFRAMSASLEHSRQVQAGINDELYQEGVRQNCERLYDEQELLDDVVPTDDEKAECLRMFSIEL